MSLPTSFTVTLQGSSSPLDVEVALDPVMIVGDPNRAVTAKVSLDPVRLVGDASQPITAKIVGDPLQPIAADLRLKNLPDLSFPQLLQLIEEVKRLDLRFCLPLNLHFGLSVFPLSLLGLDAVSFSVCGEVQAIAKKYVPNAYERCEVDCVDCVRCE